MKKVLLIIIILFSFGFGMYLLSNNSYNSLHDAIYSTYNEKYIEKIYEFDEEAFVVETKDDWRFRYFYKDGKKWKTGIYGCTVYRFNNETFGPGMKYYRSSRSNRIYIAVGSENKPINDEYKNITIADNLGSTFNMIRYKNGFVNWYTVIEQTDNDTYTIMINDIEYTIKISDLVYNDR